MWSGIPISFRIFQFFVIHTVKGFGIVNKAEIDVFWNSLAFSMIQTMLNTQKKKTKRKAMRKAILEEIIVENFHKWGRK